MRLKNKGMFIHDVNLSRSEYITSNYNIKHQLDPTGALIFFNQQKLAELRKGFFLNLSFHTKTSRRIKMLSSSTQVSNLGI